MSQHKQRSRLKEALNQEVTFERTGERFLHFAIPGAAFWGAMVLGVVAWWFFCPGDFNRAGLVIATLIIPGMTGCIVSVVVHVIWWRRYHELQLHNKRTRPVLFYIGLAGAGCVVLFDLLR